MATELIDQENLAQRFEAAQEDLEHDEAITIAEEVLGGDAAVAQAALDWSTSGSMPSFPEIEGQTPASLARDYVPTQVFTVLSVLAEDPTMLPMLDRLPKLARWPNTRRRLYT